MRHLCLAYERPPHPDAVCYPASDEDARMVLELLELPYPKRRHLAEQLRNFLKQQERIPIVERENVPLRRPSGLYVLVPWRLAKWLACALPMNEGSRERIKAQIERWLGGGGPLSVVRRDRQ